MNTNFRDLFSRIKYRLSINSTSHSSKLAPAIYSCYSHKFVKFVSIQFAFVSFLLFPLFLSAQNSGIIPQPKSFIRGAGLFQLNNNTIIGTNNVSLLPQANYLQTELRKANDWTIALDPDETKAGIDLQLINKQGVPGSYSLKIDPQSKL